MHVIDFGGQIHRAGISILDRDPVAPPTRTRKRLSSFFYFGLPLYLRGACLHSSAQPSVADAYTYSPSAD